MTEGIVLVTQRMVMRRFRPEDAALLFDLDADPEVRRYLRRHPTSMAEIESDILPATLRRYDDHPGFGRWAAEDRHTGSFLGWFALDVAAPEDRTRPELGYRLRREAWGRGLATEGAIALIDRAFHYLGVHQVVAQTMAVNAGSRRVLEKCGMRHIRTFYPRFDDPLPGTDQGEVEYRMTREEWTARQRDHPDANLGGDA